MRKIVFTNKQAWSWIHAIIKMAFLKNPTVVVHSVTFEVEPSPVGCWCRTTVTEEMWLSHAAKPCGRTEIPFPPPLRVKDDCVCMWKGEWKTKHAIPACVNCWLWSGEMVIGTALPVSGSKEKQIKIRIALILAWFDLPYEVQLHLTEPFSPFGRD